MAGYVSPELNEICTRAGIQCTVTMDPQDFKTIYQFRNFNKYSVEVSYQKQTYVVKPETTFVYKSMNGEEPKITQWFVWYQRVTE